MHTHVVLISHAHNSLFSLLQKRIRLLSLFPLTLLTSCDFSFCFANIARREMREEKGGADVPVCSTSHLYVGLILSQEQNSGEGKKRTASSLIF